MGRKHAMSYISRTKCWISYFEKVRSTTHAKLQRSVLRIFIISLEISACLSLLFNPLRTVSTFLMTKILGNSVVSSKRVKCSFSQYFIVCTSRCHIPYVPGTVVIIAVRTKHLVSSPVLALISHSLTVPGWLCFVSFSSCFLVWPLPVVLLRTTSRYAGISFAYRCSYV